MPPMPPLPNEAALLQAARQAGAVALLRTQLAPEVVAVAPGPTIGIGIGGFGGSYRSGGGVGFGMSAPHRGCRHRPRPATAPPPR